MVPLVFDGFKVTLFGVKALGLGFRVHFMSSEP